MNNKEQRNPYETPKSTLVDGIKERLGKEEYKIYLSITQPKSLSDFIQYIQHCYKELLRIGKTVYISIDATIDDVDVPEKYIKDDNIVLDISPKAIFNFIWLENAMTFTATFKGKDKNIKVPFDSLLWIYSGEINTGYDLQNL